jgi:hypothetical protein
MDEKTRRKQLQSSSSVLIPTNLNSSTQPPTRSTISPVETNESTGRETSVIRQTKANQIQSPKTRDSGHVTLSLPPRVMSRSQIMFPSCGCIMMNSHVIKLWMGHAVVLSVSLSLVQALSPELTSLVAGNSCLNYIKIVAKSIKDILLY